MRLEDYPPGVQDLLQWARHHLEQLAILEREFRAWQAAQQSGPVQMSTPAEAVQQWEIIPIVELLLRDQNCD